MILLLFCFGDVITFHYFYSVLVDSDRFRIEFCRFFGFRLGFGLWSDHNGDFVQFFHEFHEKRTERPFRTISYDAFMNSHEKVRFHTISYEFFMNFHEKGRSRPFCMITYDFVRFFDFLRKSNFDQQKK